MRSANIIGAGTTLDVLRTPRPVGPGGEPGHVPDGPRPRAAATRTSRVSSSPTPARRSSRTPASTTRSRSRPTRRSRCRSRTRGAPPAPTSDLSALRRCRRASSRSRSTSRATPAARAARSRDSGPYRPRLRARAAAQGRRGDALRLRAPRRGLLRAWLRLHRSRRRSARCRSTRSCSATTPATASSSPGRWRCCCAWAACPRACRPASRRAHSTSSAASTSSPTSTRTRGSRHGSRSYGWVPFDPTPAEHPGALDGGPGGRAVRGRHRRPRGRARRPGAARGRVRQPGPRVAPVAAGAPRGAAARAGRRDRGRAAQRLAPARLRGRATRPSPSSSAHSRAPAGRCRPTRRCASSTRRFDGTEAAAFVRALRMGRYGWDDRAPTRAARRALRRELGEGLGFGGRLRALWALPPRVVRRRP